jgi:predicted pyridoxine 5'-phosphate oxidase superfamily flavin-nucleotide-binding protein
MAERTWFRTATTMQPFCLLATMNAENASPSRTRATQLIRSSARLEILDQLRSALPAAEHLISRITGQVVLKRPNRCSRGFKKPFPEFLTT